jgi:hypothetical protein
LTWAPDQDFPSDGDYLTVTQLTRGPVSRTAWAVQLALGRGARYTFGDDDPAVLARETALVAAAFAATPGFEGTTVEHHRAWRRLLGLDRA